MAIRPTSSSSGSTETGLQETLLEQVRREEQSVLELIKNGEAFSREFIQRILILIEKLNDLDIDGLDLEDTIETTTFGLELVVIYLSETNDKLAMNVNVGTIVAIATEVVVDEVLEAGLGSLLHNTMEEAFADMESSTEQVVQRPQTFASPNFVDEFRITLTRRTSEMLSISHNELAVRYEWDETLTAHAQMKLLATQVNQPATKSMLETSFTPEIEEAIDRGFGTPEIDLHIQEDEGL